MIVWGFFFFVQERKKFLTNFKNPCWFEEVYEYYSTEPVTELRCFPYFHVFGVCKSGTTDLFYRLTRHPQIVNNNGVLNKETWYWSWRRYGQGTCIATVSLITDVQGMRRFCENESRKFNTYTIKDGIFSASI
jgi:hypothetical protein